MQDLEPILKSQVVALCEMAVEMQDEERFHAANRELGKVLELLPEPKSDWKAYGWLIANMADNHFEQKEYAEAYALLVETFEVDAGAGLNPFLLMRRGQCALELEKQAEAEELLAKALELGSKEVFEAEHSKYLKLAKQQNQA